MKYAFFPGCVLESAAKEDYLATVAVAKKLGIELEELDGWTCCGASHVQDIAPEITLATNARNIALAEEKGLNLLTVCNTCTLMLREAKNELDKNEKEKNEVNKKLAQIGKQYRGTTDITHFLWVLIRDYGLDKLKAKVVKPLTGLRVAEYYGCHILRPQTELGFEDYQMPTSLADLISAIGATPIDFSRKLDCCGFHAVYPAHDSVMQMTGSINKDAATEGADCVVTPCPLCQMQLDMFQKEAKEVVGGGKDMPIVLVTRPKTSGTRALFKQYAINGAEEADNKSLETDNSGILIQSVAQNPGAIGYVALPYLLNNDTVDSVSIDGVAPTLENTYNGTYSVWGYEHIYTSKEPKAAVKAFIEYITGADYGKRIEELGYGVSSKMQTKEVH